MRNSAVIDLDVEAGWDSEEERNEDEVELPEALGEVKHGRLLLYKRETPAELFTLVLQGEVQVAAGEEGFTSTQGPWSYLGSSALRAGMVYVPDYTAYAMGPCRLVQISRAQFAAALKAGQVQTVVGARTIKKMASSGADKAGTRADGSMGFSLGGQLHAVGHSRFMPQHLQAARGEGPGTRAYDGGEVGTTPEEVSVSVTPDGGSGEAGSPDGQRRWDPTWVRSADRQSEGDEGARQSVAGVGGRRTPEGRAGRSDVELVRQGDADSVDGGSHHSANSNWME